MNFYPFYPDTYYHVYNRGNNKQTVFFKRRNYVFFLNRLKRYILPHADLYAYCLLPNHFHLLLKPKMTPKMKKWTLQQPNHWYPCRLRNPLSQAFSNLMNSYTKALHRERETSGVLFQRRVQRIPLQEVAYIYTVYCYIENNPVKHGLCEIKEEWEFTSAVNNLKNEAVVTKIKIFNPGETYPLPDKLELQKITFEDEQTLALA